MSDAKAEQLGTLQVLKKSSRQTDVVQETKPRTIIACDSDIMNQVATILWTFTVTLAVDGGSNTGKAESQFALASPCVFRLRVDKTRGLMSCRFSRFPLSRLSKHMTSCLPPAQGALETLVPQFCGSFGKSIFEETHLMEPVGYVLRIACMDD